MSETKVHSVPLAVEKYLEGLRNLSVEPGYTQSQINIVLDKKSTQLPFLTIVMRTTGSRSISMEQALTCLLAQSNQDFEVIVCVHLQESQQNEDRIQKVEALVSLFPQSIVDRITILEINGGRRGVPMNVGIDHGSGQYIAFLDDDDLVTGSWVSCFEQEAQKNPRSIVRNRCVDRVIEKRSDDDFTPQLTQSNWIVSRANDFFFLESLERNSSPLHSYAIHRQGIIDFGLYVDTNLDVAEDWDYLMRNASLLELQIILKQQQSITDGQILKVRSICMMNYTGNRPMNK